MPRVPDAKTTCIDLHDADASTDSGQGVTSADEPDFISDVPEQEIFVRVRNTFLEFGYAIESRP